MLVIVSNQIYDRLAMRHHEGVTCIRSILRIFQALVLGLLIKHLQFQLILGQQGFASPVQGPSRRIHRSSRVRWRFIAVRRIFVSFIALLRLSFFRRWWIFSNLVQVDVPSSLIGTGRYSVSFGCHLGSFLGPGNHAFTALGSYGRLESLY